jgi:hypothetical protein
VISSKETNGGGSAESDFFNKAPDNTVENITVNTTVLRGGPTTQVNISGSPKGFIIDTRSSMSLIQLDVSNNYQCGTNRSDG